jgi:erythronate-4-phosphate dehydrogenase
LDVWEDEPEININLLNKVLIRTPHIAGYSLEGKINGTEMIFKALCDYLNTNINFNFKKNPPQNSIINFEQLDVFEKNIYDFISKVYPIEQDDQKMREISKLSSEEIGKYFDLMRKNYPVRREFNNYTVRAKNLNSSESKILKKLRFYISGD